FRWKKPEHAEKHGGGITTRSGRIPHWATSHQQPMSPPGVNNKQTEKPANFMIGPTLGGASDQQEVRIRHHPEQCPLRSRPSLAHLQRPLLRLLQPSRSLPRTLRH